MTSIIDNIKQTILTSNETFFLLTGFEYSLCSIDFKNSFNIIKSDGTFLRGKLYLDTNYTLKYQKTVFDTPDIINNSQVVLYYNPTPNATFQAVLGFKDNATLTMFFPVILDKFFFAANGMVYAAKDENTILQLYLQPSQDALYRDYVRVDTNLELQSTHKFIISRITIPLEMKDKDTLQSKLQSIWNYDNLPYNQVENKLTNNTEDIRFGWYCQTGNYTRKDGQYMDCDDDYLGRYCVGEGGATEYLFDFDNNGYRCRSYTGETSTSNINCGDYAHEVQTEYDSGTPLIGKPRIWCQYADWGLTGFRHPSNYDSKFGPEVINACAEGIGNISALPRDSNGSILAKDKLSYRFCKTMYPHTAAKNITLNPTTKSWSPWSVDTAESQIYYDFCSEHDTVSDEPRFNSNNNCKSWINGDPSRLPKVKNIYCTNYPASNKSDCGTFCIDDTLTCKQTLLALCKGTNLELQTCKNFAQEPTINLDDEINTYCTSLGNQTAITNELCGCFMPQEFYSKYFGDFERAAQAGEGNYVFKDQFGNVINLVDKINGMPKIPKCYYGNCASSLYDTYSEKEQKTQCPDVLQCIQISSFQNDGTIDAGSITYGGTQSCNITPKDAVDCVLSEWSECVNGVRTRTIVTPPLNGGKACGNLSENCGSILPNLSGKIGILVNIILVIVLLILMFIK